MKFLLIVSKNILMYYTALIYGIVRNAVAARIIIIIVIGITIRFVHLWSRYVDGTCLQYR